MTTVEDWLGKDNSLGISIWNKKYCYNDESFDQWLDRVSGGNEDVKELILSKKFLFGGRILANRGLGKMGVKACTSNCFVLPQVEDSIESIFDTASQMARTFSYGGGVGLDISQLAPRGAKINNTANETTGAVSFTDLYSMVTGLIGQHGRRGALMLSISSEHPDLEEFINAKTDIERNTKANLSVRVSDEFMHNVINHGDHLLKYYRPETDDTIAKTINAESVFTRLCDYNYDYGEPGCLFWDTIEEYNMLNTYDNFRYDGVNPCFTGDMKLKIVEGDTVKDVPLEELSGLTDVAVVSNTGEISYGNKVWCSGVKDVVLVKTANGQIIRCTPNHVFMLNDGTECMAKDLKGKRLKRFYVSGEFNDKNEALDKLISERGDYVVSVTLGEEVPVYDFSENINHWGVVEGFVVHNCAEEPLPAGGSCLLGSINLAEFVKTDSIDGITFDYDDFMDAVVIAVRALNNVLDEGIPYLPLEQQREVAKDWRQIGLGIMGLADMLIKMHVKYGSRESIELCKKIGIAFAYAGLRASLDLAIEDGAFPKCIPSKTAQSNFVYTISSDAEKKYGMNIGNDLYDIIKMRGLRNSQIFCIAPTGTIATMLGISGGIEPIFANSFKRITKSLDGKDVEYVVYPNVVKEYITSHNLKDDSELPDFFVTAQNLSWNNRVDMQATWQRYVDASISSTINLPEDFSKELVRDIYIYAWDSGCKGITIFRDGCKRDSILTTKEKDRNESCVIKIAETSDALIGKKRKLMTGCGSLHVSAFFDPNTGKLLECFLSKGSAGGCNNFMIGLSRMISLSSRAGIPLSEIVEQMNSTGSCPSYAVRRATKGDTSIGSCCPMAVGKALLEMENEMKKSLGKTTDVEPKEDKNSSGIKCPTCGAKLQFTGGCMSCPNCGYSKCD